MTTQRYFRLYAEKGGVWAQEEGDQLRLGFGNPYDDDWALSETLIGSQGVTYLPPATPRAIIGVGRSYPAPGQDIPNQPILFAKLPCAICGHKDVVTLASMFTSVMAEGELVLVLGKPLKNASAKEAQAAIFGVTIGNDITGLPVDMDRILNIKAADGFAPIGPSLVTGLNIDDLEISVAVNGTVAAQGSTRNHGYGFAHLLSSISRYFTLMPGDLIFTGSPSIVPEVMPGDRVDITIPEIGCLSNQIS
jgi:2-keto-4-pentenoate hydratase/2-oxohepta-3-ene-1,7-dioic acid hydratase in catechol pathway